jgi:hypothetical protein
MKLALDIPPESKDLRDEVIRVSNSLSGSDLDWDPLAIWFGNKIPKYLWTHWKSELKPAGFTWQKFLRLLRYRTDGAVLWFHGELPWEDFSQQTIDLINGPLGKKIACQNRT